MKSSETICGILYAIFATSFFVLIYKYDVAIPLREIDSIEIYNASLFIVTTGVLLLLELTTAWQLTLYLAKNKLVGAIGVTVVAVSTAYLWRSTEPVSVETWAIFVLILPLLHIYIWISYGVRYIVGKGQREATAG